MWKIRGWMMIGLVTMQLSTTKADDCSVSATGGSQPWTVPRSLQWRSSGAVATVTYQSFHSSPPGRSQLVFSVMSAAAEGAQLQIRLLSLDSPGGYLITLTPTGWTLLRTFVGSSVLMASSVLPRTSTGGSSTVGRTTRARTPHAVDPVSTQTWTAYQLTVNGAEQLELVRLWDNETTSAILSVSDPQPLLRVPVDMATMRIVDAGQSGEDTDPASEQRWTFWKFNCAPYYRERGPLCDIWPSWAGVVPRLFDLPSVRINPSTSISVRVRTAGTAQLRLYETAERYYVITLTASTLSLSKRVFGSTGEVTRTCLHPPLTEDRFRLIWISVLVGYIQIGLDEPQLANSTCDDPTTTAPPDTTLVETTVMTNRGNITQVSKSDRDDEDLSEVNLLDQQNIVKEQRDPQDHDHFTRTTLLSWRDPESFYILYYGFRTLQAPGLWTVDCTPESDSEQSIKSTSKRRLKTSGIDGNSFHSLKADDDSEDARIGLPPARPSRPPGAAARRPRYLTALIVLSVVSAALLLLSAVLLSSAISRRRRSRAELHLLHERRVSLAGEQQLASSMGHEYAEMVYDDVRSLNVQPGGSSFRPLRRQDTPAVQRRSPSPPLLPPPPDAAHMY